jgi:hypothetical protein
MITTKNAETDDLTLWVREQMAQYGTDSRPMCDDDLFLRGQR